MRRRTTTATLSERAIDRLQNVPQLAQEAVSYAKERNFERETVVDERDIMRDALRRDLPEMPHWRRTRGRV